MSGTTRSDDPPADAPMEVGVVTFSGLHGAEHAFAAARDRDPDAGWMAAAAFVEVHRRDRIVVRGTVFGHYVDVDGRGDAIGEETGVGAVVGAALGLPLGPPGFAVGLVGGGTVGGAAEARQVSQPEGPAVDAIREQVPEGSSAVVVFSGREDISAMFHALLPAADELVRHRLTPDAEAELRSALAEAPAARPLPS